MESVESLDSPDSPDSVDSVFATSGGVDIWWDKNGNILFNLTKLQLSLSQSLLAQEFLNMELVESVCREAGWALCLKLNEN